MQKYLDAYAECIEREGKDFNSYQRQELLQTVQLLDQFKSLLKNKTTETNLQTVVFEKKATDIMLKDVEKLNPESLMKVI